MSPKAEHIDFSITQLDQSLFEVTYEFIYHSMSRLVAHLSW